LKIVVATSVKAEKHYKKTKMSRQQLSVDAQSIDGS